MNFRNFCKWIGLAISLIILVACSQTSKQGEQKNNHLIVRQTEYGLVKGSTTNGILTWKGVPYGRRHFWS